MASWQAALNEERRKPQTPHVSEVRTPFERDFDRILFSTPVRRLADKTQVFPLERHDSIRTRLTHSFEVSNLARSIGVDLAFNHDVGSETTLPQRNVPALLAAISLVHDLGNPPFGHQGESAIRWWFKQNENRVFVGSEGLTQAMRNDYLKFDGNAQTLRLVTRLQLISDEFGLDLTYGSLAGLLKYTVASDGVDKNSKNVGKTKTGFFHSEKSIVEDVQAKTGLMPGQRHPLTYVMEACDDIAYAVVDAEDAVKKSLASYPDLDDALRDRRKGSGIDEVDTASSDLVLNAVLTKVRRDRDRLRHQGLSPAEFNDLSMQKFRVHAMHQLVGAATERFIEQQATLLNGDFEGDLLSSSRGAELIARLKDFDKAIAYRHRSVLGLELKGFKVITSLMDKLWEAIDLLHPEPGMDRVDDGRVKTPEHDYVFGRISENYRRVFEANKGRFPLAYLKIQLMTDMISGMTDSFAIALYEEFSALGK